MANLFIYLYVIEILFPDFLYVFNMKTKKEAVEKHTTTSKSQEQKATTSRLQDQKTVTSTFGD